MRNNMVKIEKPNNLGGYPVSVHNHIHLRYAVMNDSIITKICSKCQVEKPVSDFNDNKACPDGLQYRCKGCMSRYSSKYRNDNKEKLSKKAAVKRKVNKIKIAAYASEYYQANKEEIKIRIDANKEKTSKKSIIYREENKEKIKARRYANKEKTKKQSKLYQKTEAGRTSQHKANHKRRALERGCVVESFSPSEVFERDNYTCQICGTKTRPDFKNSYHPKYPNLDHIIPLSLGGEHSKRNTQCLCRQCNVTKSNTGTGDQLRLFG